MLPADVRIGTGSIISHDGRTSTQHDLVLYDRSILPAALYEGGFGLFPIESVAYTVEVKSRITAQELRTAHDAAAELLSFPYSSGLHDSNDVPLPHAFIKVISAVFAFDTDLNASTDLERYEDHLGGAPPALKAICVAGSGCWDHRGASGWAAVDGVDFGEIVQFVGQVANSFRRVLDTRGKPRLGVYLR